MSFSIAASHAQGKVATDKIFGANGAAKRAANQYGADKVVNATIGAFMDEHEALRCIPTVETTLRSLPVEEIINYAPIAGMPAYLKAAIDLTFSQQRPEAYIDAVATAGGTGAIHHTIWNYSEIGDVVLTSDWYWGPYKILCNDSLRKLETYTLFDETQQFNIKAFATKVQEVLQKQDKLVIIINTPAHNPTGYSLKDSEWDAILQVFKDIVAVNNNKRIIPLIDIAYLDYAGEKEACRAFLQKMGGLPPEIFPILSFSMSKSCTMYGQRTGAMIGISSSKQGIEEFASINQYSCRATWSNINRGAMQVLATIHQDPTLLAQLESERNEFYQLIRKRADIFMQEAAAASLHMLPYIAGFFLTIPAKQPDAVCEKLHDDLIFAVPLAKGIRIAVCAIPSAKITGMAGKIAKAMQIVEGAK